MQDRINKIIQMLVKELIGDEKAPKLNIDELSKRLVGEGFKETEIQRALKHLLQTLDVGRMPAWQRSEKKPPPIRVLIPEEMHFFSPEAYGYLIQLQILGLVSALQIEHVIERCFMMGLSRVGLEDIKIVVSQFLLGKELGTFDTDAVYYPGNDKLN